MVLSELTRTILVLTAFAMQCSTFNVDVVHPVIFHGPATDPRGIQTRADTYFGYSVGLGSGGRQGIPFVLIGAPRANSTLGVNPPSRVLEPGAMYKCPLREGAECEEMLVDATGNDIAPGFEYTDLKDQGWLGGAMDVESSGQGRLAVSAFRWRNKKYPQHYLGNGACYLSDASVRDNNFLKLVPLFETNKQSFTIGRSTHVYFYSYGQAGTSVHFPDNGRELVLGAPGVFDWTGTLVRLQDGDHSDSGGGNNRRRRRQAALELEEVVIPNPVTTKPLHRYDYLGYSVSSGRFYSSDDSTLYLAGAPRAASGKGKVYLLDFPRNEYEPYDILFEREGENVGDYFGSSVLAVDLTGDGLSEVLVGAPLFGTADTPELGQVTVYINGDKGLFEPTARPLTGSGVARARFGSALARAGDLDQDGFEDIAIGAPYEDDGRGAIYIYRGGRGDFVTTPSQRIAGKDIGESLRGFGISISRGLDIDSNRYSDLLVGSYASGDAVLLRTKPVIEFVSSLTAKPDKLEKDTKEFEVEMCLGYRGNFVPSRADTNVTLKIDSYHAQSRLVVQNKDVGSVTFPLKITRDRSQCRSFTVAIRSSSRIDYTIPIQLSLRYSLKSDGRDEPGSRPVIVSTRTDKRTFRVSRKRRQADTFALDDFCSSCPVPNINMASQQQVRLNVPFSVGCGADGICSTDLRLSYSFPDLKRGQYVIGSTSQLTLELSLKNAGEPASLAELSVDIPSPLALVRVPPTCQERDPGHGSVVLTCGVLPHPFYSDSSYTMRLVFDAADVTSAYKMLKFNASVTSTGIETVPTDNILNFTLPLVSQADMEILGSPLLEQVFYDKEEDRSSDKKGTPNYLNVQHSYQILKYLPTPVKAVAISFIIPVNFTTGGGSVNFLRLYPPSATISGQPLTCSLQGTTDYIRSSDASAAGASDAEAIDLDEQQLKPDLTRRRRRQAGDMPAGGAPLANGTYILNCTRGSALRCVRMTCQTVSFLTASARASVTLNMRVDMHVLEPLLGGRDQASVVTQGFVQILDGTSISPDINRRPDVATVATALLPSKLESKPLAWWIILLAVLGAFLLLGAIAYLLYRLGFFKRTKHEQLLEEKKDAEIEENFGGPKETDALNPGDD